MEACVWVYIVCVCVCVFVCVPVYTEMETLVMDWLFLCNWRKGNQFDEPGKDDLQSSGEHIYCLQLRTLKEERLTAS
jgi:hypothetical protein